MTFVDDGFTALAAGRPLPPPWDARNWAENDRWGWESDGQNDPDELYSAWYTVAGQSPSNLCAAVCG